MKLYIDSNVWINYLWIEKVSLPRNFIKENTIRERSHKIITSLGKGNYKVISSLFNESEISGYFGDYLRFIEGLNRGFDYTDCHKYKKKFLLKEKDKKEITSYFEHIANQSFIEVVEPDLDEKSMVFFRMATCNYYLDYMDAFHLIIALIENCKYLITEDSDFKRKGNEFLENNKLIKNIRVINGKEALNYLGRGMKRGLGR